MIHCQTLSIFCRSDSVGKKAIQTLKGFEISKEGKVARRQYTDRLNPASCFILDGTTKAGDNTRLRTEGHNAAKAWDTRDTALDGAQLNVPI